MKASLLATLGLAALFTASGTARAQEEVPFITTPDRVTVAMLQLAGVGARDHVIDLGSGDGRIVITAAKRFGASGLGVEIVPELVAKSRANAERAGVTARAEFREQDLFKTDLSPATVVTMYLLPEVNLQLRPALLALKPGTRLVSHDWDMGDWAPDQTLTLDVPEKSIGREKLSRLHLWVVPAAVEGLWCGPRGSALRIAQRYQHFSVAATGAAGLTTNAAGRIDGDRLRLLAPQGRSLNLQWQTGRLVVTASDGGWARLRGTVFEKTSAGNC